LFAIVHCAVRYRKPSHHNGAASHRAPPWVGTLVTMVPEMRYAHLGDLDLALRVLAPVRC